MFDHTQLNFVTETVNGKSVGCPVCPSCGQTLSHLTGWDRKQIMLAPRTGLMDIMAMEEYNAEIEAQPLIDVAPGGGKISGHLVDIWICDNDPACVSRAKFGGKFIVVNVASLPR